MQLPDNRIRFPATRIDFTTTVGLTGREHDNYPPPGGQARFDHMRMFLIGLLAQQASFSPPTEYRDGTPWFDLNSLTLKININGDWRPYAEVIALTEPDENANFVSLAEWYASASAALASLSPEVVFTGKSNSDGIDTIHIPEAISGQLSREHRCFLYVNGSLINPLVVSLVGSPTPTTIRLAGAVLSRGDVFVAVLRRIPSGTYYSQIVTIQ